MKPKTVTCRALLRTCKSKFKALLGLVDGLLEIELGLTYVASDYPLVLCCKFDSKEALEGYQGSPGASGNQRLHQEKYQRTYCCGL